MLAPSILRSPGTLPPASAANVGRMSNMPQMASLAVPAGILPGPPGDGRHAHAAFPGGALVAAQRRVHRPRRAAVVAGENDERPLGEAVFADSVQNSAHAPVHFLDPVRVDAVRRFARPFLARIDREMHGVVRQVEEEGRVLVRGDELHGLGRCRSRRAIAGRRAGRA